MRRLVRLELAEFIFFSLSLCIELDFMALLFLLLILIRWNVLDVWPL